MHIFDWVVRAINSSIKGADNAQTDLPYIGLLDIFGFEVFAFNSFEQLCINFTNEKLQQFFLMAVFNAEAEEHDKEGVPLSKVEYQDNQGCIELLEQPASAQAKKPAGLFALLDTQCKTPNGSEGEFCKSVNKEHGAASLRRRVPQSCEGEGLVIRHFAGKMYPSQLSSRRQSSLVRLEKNNDALDNIGYRSFPPDVPLLSGSTSPSLRQNQEGVAICRQALLSDVKSLPMSSLQQSRSSSDASNQTWRRYQKCSTPRLSWSSSDVVA